MTKQASNAHSFVFKLGVVLLFIAGLFWVGIIIIPFLPLTTTVKAGSITFSIVAGEIAFWLGAFCTGKEFIERYKARINDRWKRRK